MKARAFILIELLFALFIESVLLLILAASLLYVFRAYQTELQKMEVLKNTEQVFNLLRPAIETAGLLGCSSNFAAFTLTDDGASAFNRFDLNHAFLVYGAEENQWVPALPDLPHWKPQLNSDVISLHAMSSITAQLLSPLYQSNEAIVSPSVNFHAGEDIMISDCSHGVLAHIDKVKKEIAHHQQILFLSKKILSSFDTSSEVGSLQTLIFYIQGTGHADRFGPINALYQIDEAGRQEVLVSGIDQLKTRLLVRLPNGMLAWILPRFVSAWSQVVAVQVTVTGRTGAFTKSHTVTIALRERGGER